MLDSHFDNSLKPVSKSHERNPVLLVGIGVFAWMGIGKIAFLLQSLLKDSFFNMGVKPIYTLMFSELIYASTYIIGILILVNLVRKNKFSDWRIFKFTVLFVFIGIILQILQKEINELFRTENYFDNLENYFSFLNKNPLFYFAQIADWVLVCLIVFIIFYLNKKKVGQQQ